MKMRRGFTLVELMITLAIVGVLAAIAIPMFLDAIKKSKRSEVRIQMQKIVSSSKEYYVANAAFPGTIAITPGISCCQQNFRGKKQCAPTFADWAVPTWQSLDFSIDEPFYYQYIYANLGNVFIAEGFGDLDCDGIFSWLEVEGTMSPDGNLSLQWFEQESE